VLDWQSRGRGFKSPQLHQLNLSYVCPTSTISDFSFILGLWFKIL
jgi:hypothetical protein